MDVALFLGRLGENIAKARWLAGLTQEEVAAKTGITYRYYQSIERGRANVTVRTLLELTAVLGYSPAELIDVDFPGKRRPPLRGTKATPPKVGRKPRDEGATPTSRRHR